MEKATNKKKRTIIKLQTGHNMLVGNDDTSQPPKEDEVVMVAVSSSTNDQPEEEKEEKRRKHKKQKKEKKKKEKKEKKKKKRKRNEDEDEDEDDDDHCNLHTTTMDRKKQRQEQEQDSDNNDDDNHPKKKKKPKKQKKQTTTTTTTTTKQSKDKVSSSSSSVLSFPYKYIVAPMVGASELPFRLLCRKYGAQLAYTPMMSAAQFGTDSEYRNREFQTTIEDRPLVCHFAANDPKDFAKAAKVAEPYCDAIDLNLGCPQRTAYVGHFGSYLLTPKDRSLLLDIVQAGVRAVSIPIFVKIRLLDTMEETLELVRQLTHAGATLIAIHARYRATFDRKGPGARDGPAMLDQVAMIRKVIETDETLKHVLIVTNGNTITYEDVVENLNSTRADGIMSAEGILDNPALFLGRWGSREEGEKPVTFPYPPAAVVAASMNKDEGRTSEQDSRVKKRRKLVKKMREIERIEQKFAQDGSGDEASLTKDQRDKLATKAKIQKALHTLELELAASESDGVTSRATTAAEAASKGSHQDDCGSKVPTPTTIMSTLGTLYKNSDDKIALALEYVNLVRQFPVPIRSVIFHIRRMIKTELTTFQLMDDCLKCTTVDALTSLLEKIRSYRDRPETFQFDVQKAKLEKEALEKKRREEGKRKAYEARMIRKAKREGKTGADLEYYLRQGAAVPTKEIIEKLHTLPTKEEQIALWKDQDHSQHCLAYHLTGGKCPRARACAFLHVDPQSKTSFVEQDEVAG